VQETKIAAGQFFKARKDTAIMLDLVEKTLYQMPLTAEPGIILPLCCASAAKNCFKTTTSMLCLRPRKVLPTRSERSLDSVVMVQLVDQAFGIKAPLLAFNTLQIEPEQSEHKGLMHLLKGLFGTFRNTTAHAPKIKWVIDEQDALDMLSLASLLHRQLDKAVRIHNLPPEQ
jgi:uncharacterized protein (TIGR02391 family)